MSERLRDDLSMAQGRERHQRRDHPSLSLPRIALADAGSYDVVVTNYWVPRQAPRRRSRSTLPRVSMNLSDNRCSRSGRA